MTDKETIIELLPGQILDVRSPTRKMRTTFPAGKTKNDTTRTLMRDLGTWVPPPVEPPPVEPPPVEPPPVEPPPTTGYYLSPTGNDGAAGTQAAPWRSLAKFASVAVAGDTLWCRGGTYANTTRTTVSSRSGAAGKPITVKAYPGETPVFAGPGAASTAQFLMLTGGVSYWVIDGLTLQNFKTGPSAVIWIGDANVSTHHHIIRNCTFTQFLENSGQYNHCVYLSYNANDITAEDNELTGSGQIGVDGCAFNLGDHSPAPRRFVIQRNIIRSFGGHPGAIWTNGGGDGLISHNTFLGTCRFFIRPNNYTGPITARDNVGVPVDPSGEPIYDPGGGITQDHNYWGQALNADGSLKAGSPAINGASDGSDAGAIQYP